MDDYLALEALLIERLRVRCGDLLRQVAGAADLEGVVDAQQVVPAAHVLYSGYAVADDIGQGVRVKVRQRWLVVIAVRSARDVAGGGGARAEAGPIVSAVLGALLGWRPSTDHTPLKLDGGAPAALWSGGYGYVPLLFTTHVIAEGIDP